MTGILDRRIDDTPITVVDFETTGELLELYLQCLQERQIRTFSELAKLKKYKFIQSWGDSPLPPPEHLQLRRNGRLWSRIGHVPERQVDPVEKAIRSYWDTLKAAVADLKITDEELAHIVSERKRLGLDKEQIRCLHARAFQSAIALFVDDRRIDDQEVRKLRLLHRALARLGWAPGQ